MQHYPSNPPTVFGNVGYYEISFVFGQYFAKCINKIWRIIPYVVEVYILFLETSFVYL